MTTTILNYKSVLVLAQSKGYNNVTIAFTRKVWGDNAPGWQEIEKDENLCELTLIQKWLRDKQGFDLYISPDEGIFKVGQKSYGYTIDDKHFENGFSTYEEAMLNGINEALKLL